MIETIRREIQQEEFDYQTLLDCLKDYSRPRDKISDLLRKGNIIRIKKGLYIFGDEYRQSTYSREIFANLIYGPSYISLDPWKGDVGSKTLYDSRNEFNMVQDKMFLFA